MVGGVSSRPPGSLQHPQPQDPSSSKITSIITSTKPTNCVQHLVDARFLRETNTVNRPSMKADEWPPSRSLDGREASERRLCRRRTRGEHRRSRDERTTPQRAAGNGLRFGQARRGRGQDRRRINACDPRARPAVNGRSNAPECDACVRGRPGTTKTSTAPARPPGRTLAFALLTPIRPPHAPAEDLPSRGRPLTAFVLRVRRLSCAARISDGVCFLTCTPGLSTAPDLSRD